jgi:hypothetical protein
MPTELLRHLANQVRRMRLSSDDDEPTDVVDELCEIAIRCSNMEERRGVDELQDPQESRLLLETFQDLEKRYGGAKTIPEVERLLHRSQNAQPEFVAGIYATIAALEEAQKLDAIDDRVRRERASLKKPANDGGDQSTD